MTQLPNSRERWLAERLGIEAMGRDMGDPNLFLTLNMDPRADPQVRRLIYELEVGKSMPPDYFERDNEKFTDLLSKYAVQIAIYLSRKTKIFLNAFLCDICGIPENDQNHDWMNQNDSERSYYWSRVEYTESRGVQHYHTLARYDSLILTYLFVVIDRFIVLVVNKCLHFT